MKQIRSIVVASLLSAFLAAGVTTYTQNGSYEDLRVDYLRVKQMEFEGPARINLPWGFIAFHNNEVSIVSTIDDPPKLRLASVSQGLGAISWNKYDPNTGTQYEVALLQGKIDERYPTLLGGEMTLHLNRPDLPFGDASMRRAMELRSDRPEITGGGIAGSQPINASRFYSANRCWVVNTQDDGHIVQYDTHCSADESQWSPVWSQWGGLLRPLPWGN